VVTVLTPATTMMEGFTNHLVEPTISFNSGNGNSQTRGRGYSSVFAWHCLKISKVEFWFLVVDFSVGATGRHVGAKLAIAKALDLRDADLIGKEIES
jgi:hypothetical protein